MESREVQPIESIYSMYMKMLLENAKEQGDVLETKKVFDKAISNGIVARGRMVTPLIDAFCRVGLVSDAIALKDRLTSEFNIPVTEHDIVPLVTASGEGKITENVYKFLTELSSTVLDVDSVNFEKLKTFFEKRWVHCIYIFSGLFACCSFVCYKQLLLRM